MATVTNDLLAVADMLCGGAIGVLPTDTLYGIVASAHNQDAVERVYAVRPRESEKRCIVLIADVAQMWDPLTPEQTEFVWSVWPGPYSIVLPSANAPEFVTRGQGTVAYRLPADERLRQFLRQSGPIIAPSANHPDDPPATTILKAQEYFGDAIDFYVDGGDLSENSASTLLVFNDNGQVERIR